MKIYLSGPISGLPPTEVHEKFAAAEQYFKDQGIETVNPLKNGLPASAPWREHMLRDLELLSECDTVYMMKGWKRSKGARVEFATAVESCKTIMFEDGDQRR